MRRAEHCAKMRAGKERKRLATPGSEAREVGFVFLCGPVFRGCHTVSLHKVDDGRRTLDVRVDGVLRAARTERGLRAMLARKIAEKVVSAPTG